MPLILSLSITLFLMLLSGLYEVKKKKKQAIKQTQTLMILNVSFQIFLLPFLSLPPSFLPFFISFFPQSALLKKKF